MSPNYVSGFLPAALRAAREAAGLSIGELAERISVDRTSLSRWEAGSRRPQVGTIVELAEALDVDPSTLTGQPATLAELRASRGLTQQQAADALGVTQPRYNVLEQGKAMLRADHVITLAALLDCDAQTILDMVTTH